jgi:predicted small lipoprotein YifL
LYLFGLQRSALKWLKKVRQGEIVTHPARFAMLQPARGGLSLRPRRTDLFRFGLASLIAAGLAACGRKGPLDLPPADAAAATQQEKQNAATTLTSPLGGTSQPAAQNPAAPNRPFVLDPLLN